MTDALHLALLRGSAEHLYDFCTRYIGSYEENCIKCPLHVACSQARAEPYTSLRDLMGSILYCIMMQKKAEEDTANGGKNNRK